MTEIRLTWVKTGERLPRTEIFYKREEFERFMESLTEEEILSVKDDSLADILEEFAQKTTDQLMHEINQELEKAIRQQMAFNPSVSPQTHDLVLKKIASASIPGVMRVTVPHADPGKMTCDIEFKFRTKKTLTHVSIETTD